MSSLLYYFTIFVVGIVRHLRTARTRLELQLCHRKRIRKLGQKDVLTREQKAQIRKYFAPYKKHVTTAFHNFYVHTNGEFHVNYLPEDFHYNYIDQYFNDWRECYYIDNKCFYHRMFTGVRQAENVASRIGGLWFTGDFQQVTRQELSELLAREQEIVVKKATCSEGGKGVYFMKGTDFGEMESQFEDDIAIQRPLKQHEAMNTINASSINTIRLISLLSDDGVKIYSTVLRMGTGGARVDNSHSGGLHCGITLDGKLKKIAYSAEGKNFDTHPDTGLVFEGYELPGYQKCRELVHKLHVQVPRFRLVSWDFAIDPEGEPVLIEANLHYGGIELHQMANGPVFGEDTEKILKEVFGK